MAVKIVAALLLFGLLCAAAQYQPNWDSLDKRPIPSWFDESKFGIFIHWGLYAVPSWAPVGVYAEWYWNALVSSPSSETAAFHNKTYGPNFKYEDFAPWFKAELFDPVAWVDLFEKSGAKYIVPTSKHHEGFTLWRSAQSWNWNAVDVGPHRDLLNDLLNEVRKRPGMHAGLYYSLYEWYHPLYVGPNPKDYVEQVMLPQMYDVVTNYKPELIFTDGEWDYPSDFWNSTTFLAWLFNESPVKDTVVVNDRWGKETRGVHGGYYTPEYSAVTYDNHKWEENSGIDVHSFGLNRNTPADQYQTPKQLVDLLVRCVAFGGNLLLDIGPAADGTIPTIMQDRLLAMGDWLKVNGDAIYSTKKWRVGQEPHITQPVVWTIMKNANNIQGGIPSPHSSSNVITYYGDTSTADACQAYCSNDKTCTSFTWHDSSCGSWSLGCYGRNDTTWPPTSESDHTSGGKAFTTVSYTAKGSNVYAFVSVWPDDNRAELSSPIPSAATTVTMLGHPTPLKWSGTVGKAGMVVDLDLTVAQLPCDHTWVLLLTGVS